MYNIIHNILYIIRISDSTNSEQAKSKFVERQISKSQNRFSLYYKTNLSITYVIMMKDIVLK